MNLIMTVLIQILLFSIALTLIVIGIITLTGPFERDSDVLIALLAILNGLWVIYKLFTNLKPSQKQEATL